MQLELQDRSDVEGQGKVGAAHSSCPRAVSLACEEQDAQERVAQCDSIKAGQSYVTSQNPKRKGVCADQEIERSACDTPSKAGVRGQVVSAVPVGLDEEVRERGAKHKAEVITSAALYDKLEEQQFRCALSGRELTTQSMALDHKVARIYADGERLSNLHWVDAQVNKAKGTMDMDAFIAMCREVVAFQDRAGPCSPP